MWTKVMVETVRYFESSCSLIDRVDYNLGEEPFEAMRSPGRFIGVIIASAEHPVYFTKTLGYSVSNIITDFFDRE